MFGRNLPSTFFEAKMTPLVGRGGPRIGRGCTHVHPILLANEIEVSR